MEETVFRPLMLLADESGNIYEEPELYMVARQGEAFTLPKPEDFMALPKNARYVLLPKRNAVGLNFETGELEQADEIAVAAVAPSNFIITGHPAYVGGDAAAPLPNLPYAAIGFGDELFYICAKQLDFEMVKQRKNISGQIKNNIATKLAKELQHNPLALYMAQVMLHPQVFQGELPFSYEQQPIGLPVAASQTALAGTLLVQQEKGQPPVLHSVPSGKEYAEVIEFFVTHWVTKPTFVLGGLFAGEPLGAANAIVEALALLRQKNICPKVHLRTNGEQPEVLVALLEAGVTSVELTLQGATQEVYAASAANPALFEAQMQSLAAVQARNVPLALDVLYFTGVTDAEHQVDALLALVHKYNVSAILLRNRATDPVEYWNKVAHSNLGPSIGMQNLRKRIKKECAGVHFGHYAPAQFV